MVHISVQFMFMVLMYWKEGHLTRVVSVSDCSKMQLSTDFMTWKILTSSQIIDILDYLNSLQMSLINILTH